MIPTNLKEKLISYCDSDKQKIFWINRYIKYIEGCQTKNFFDTQIHKHHIVPKSWGGTDDSCNLIALPPRYHFVAHLLLSKTNDIKMITAFWFMCNTYKQRVNSVTYERLLINCQKALKSRIGKSVCNLNTGDVYETATDASIAIGMGSQAVACAIFNNMRSGGYYWQYVGQMTNTTIAEELSRLITLRQAKDQRRPVINLTTGKVYSSVAEASDYCQMKKRSYISDSIKHHRKCRRSYWQYLDQMESTNIEHELERIKSLQNSNKKQVINISTGEVFDSARQAARHYNYPKDAISTAIRNERPYYGHVWKYVKTAGLDMSLTNGSEGRNRGDLSNTQPKTNRNLKVVDLNTGCVYNSCYAAAISLGLKSTSCIQTAIRKGIKAAGHYWQFASVLEESSIQHELDLCIKIHNERLKKNKKPAGISVCCVEDNRIFDSIAAAARYCGVSKTRGFLGIKCAIESGGVYKNKHWTIV